MFFEPLQYYTNIIVMLHNPKWNKRKTTSLTDFSAVRYLPLVKNSFFPAFVSISLSSQTSFNMANWWLTTGTVCRLLHTESAWNDAMELSKETICIDGLVTAYHLFLFYSRPLFRGLLLSRRRVWAVNSNTRIQIRNLYRY